jgi:hypothetical protein
MTHSNLKIEVQPPYIHVVLRGTCLRAKYRKQDAPWLAPEEYGEDPEAAITFSEFRTLAWEVANEAGAIWQFRVRRRQNPAASFSIGLGTEFETAAGQIACC